MKWYWKYIILGILVLLLYLLSIYIGIGGEDLLA